MPDTKISALPAAAALLGTESLPIVQSGATVKTTLAAIAALATPARRFEHVQTAASDTWIINHNFGLYPMVQLLTVGGVEFDGCIVQYSINQARAILDIPMSGVARCQG